MAEPELNSDSGRESWIARPRRAIIRTTMRVVMFGCVALIRIGRLVHRRRVPLPSKSRILLTGRFESENWARAHLVPLAQSRHCQQLQVVSTFVLAALPNIQVVYPPRLMIRLFGNTGARLLTFAYLSVRNRPDVIGGFHFLVNGLLSVLLASCLGRRSLYFCVGGPPEVVDGGVHSGTHGFAAVKMPDRVIERLLITVVGACDLIVTMGTQAAEYFREQGIKSRIEVISGGIDVDQFQLGNGERTADLVLIGRLVPIKRVDVFLEAVQIVTRRLPGLRVNIVGDGPLRDELQRQAAALNVCEQVQFVGFQSNIQQWLACSRLFVLTSDSEGLSLALMEAMMCGLPAVVSRVGDLPDLVQDGVNGYLVPRREPARFAERIVELLSNQPHWERFAKAARAAAERYRVGAATEIWDRILTAI